MFEIEPLKFVLKFSSSKADVIILSHLTLQKIQHLKMFFLHLRLSKSGISFLGKLCISFRLSPHFCKKCFTHALPAKHTRRTKFSHLWYFLVCTQHSLCQNNLVSLWQSRATSKLDHTKEPDPLALILWCRWRSLMQHHYATRLSPAKTSGPFEKSCYHGCYRRLVNFCTELKAKIID